MNLALFPFGPSFHPWIVKIGHSLDTPLTKEIVNKITNFYNTSSHLTLISYPQNGSKISVSQNA